MELKTELQQSQKNCFTCLRQSEECMQISSEASDLNPVPIIELLTKHFWFQQEDFNGEQHIICWICWNQLEGFHRFYQEVEQNHRTLNQEPTKVSGCKVEPNLTEDEVCNDVDEIQHDEIEVKEESWVESEDKASDGQFKFEFSSDEGNNEEGDSEPKETPFEKRGPLPTRIGEPVDARLANNPYKDIKQWIDDEAIIKSHIQYICSVCKNNCSTFNQLKVHMINVHEMQGCITCCGTRFYYRLALLEHVQKLQDPDRFKCDACHNILSSSQALRKHKREIHAKDEEKEYRCDQSPKRCKRTNLLEYHLKGHDNQEKGTFTCPHCETSFQMAAQMNAHIKINHKSFICDVCGKGFSSEPDFLRHKEQHELFSEKLRVQCNICHKWLKNKHNLEIHYRRHTDPMNCDICGHVALDSLALTNHKRIRHHSEGTLYPCNVCDKKFTRIGNMKLHQTIKHPKRSEQKNDTKAINID